MGHYSLHCPPGVPGGRAKSLFCAGHGCIVPSQKWTKIFIASLITLGSFLGLVNLYLAVVFYLFCLIPAWLKQRLELFMTTS